MIVFISDEASFVLPDIIESECQTGVAAIRPNTCQYLSDDAEEADSVWRLIDSASPCHDSSNSRLSFLNLHCQNTRASQSGDSPIEQTDSNTVMTLLRSNDEWEDSGGVMVPLPKVIDVSKVTDVSGDILGAAQYHEMDQDENMTSVSASGCDTFQWGVSRGTSEYPEYNRFTPSSTRATTTSDSFNCGSDLTANPSHQSPNSPDCIPFRESPTNSPTASDGWTSSPLDSPCGATPIYEASTQMNDKDASPILLSMYSVDTMERDHEHTDTRITSNVFLDDHPVTADNDRQQAVKDVWSNSQDDDVTELRSSYNSYKKEEEEEGDHDAWRYLEDVVDVDYSHDLASYAASVASGTAHLTSMSASPQRSVNRDANPQVLSLHVQSQDPLNHGDQPQAGYDELETSSYCKDLKSEILDDSPSLEELDSGTLIQSFNTDESQMGRNSHETSPTATTFKRCASYSNIQCAVALAEVLDNKFVASPNSAEPEPLGVGLDDGDCFDLSAFQEFKQLDLENGHKLPAQTGSNNGTNAFTDSFTDEWFDTIVTKKMESTNPFNAVASDDFVKSVESEDGVNPFTIEMTESTSERMNPFSCSSEQPKDLSNTDMDLNLPGLLLGVGDSAIHEHHFLSDEEEDVSEEDPEEGEEGRVGEDREIDLDEDIPPRKPTKQKSDDLAYLKATTSRPVIYIFQVLTSLFPPVT